jgi:8-oxo-dGTP diphosphatase
MSQVLDFLKNGCPAVTVDIILFTVREGQLEVVLAQRGIEPYKGQWALPGGFVRMEESLDAAAKRELAEEVGVGEVYLEQLCTFGEPHRDPRGRVITVAYFALVPEERHKLSAASDASDARWFPVRNLPQLAFDHRHIIGQAVDRLQSKLEYSTIAVGLLPDSFRLSELQRTYEVILNRELDKRNFRKKMISLGLLEATGKKELRGAHRPAQLYRFKDREVRFFA